MQALMILGLILQPIQPQIWMGDSLPPVKGMMEYDAVNSPYIIVEVPEWLRLKDALEGSPDICEKAVKATAETCKEQALKLVEAEKKRDAAKGVIEAYQLQLKDKDQLILQQSAQIEKRDKILKIGGISAGALVLTLSSILIVKAAR
jgi:hypothetical protein